MNKPLLPAYERKRASWREIVLALIALGSAAGWLNERMEHRTSEEVKEFVNALRQVRHNPGQVVSVIIYSGGFPVACRMQRFDPGPPVKEPHEDSATGDSAPVDKPAVDNATEHTPAPTTAVKPAGESAAGETTETAGAKAAESKPQASGADADSQTAEQLESADKPQ